jgi:C-terminal processing protease CtpA/Prc
MTKLNKTHRPLFLLLCLCALSGSCTVEELPEPEPSEEQSSVNEWIEQTMRRYYLWENEIPDGKRLDFRQEAEPFFFSLLTQKDGKTESGGHYFYSSINRKNADGTTKSYRGEGYSFGFEFQYYYIRNRNMYALLVLYVLPGSPAEQNGVRRGDWIVSIGGNKVPADAASLLKALDTASPVTTSFEIAKEPGASVSIISLTAAAVTDNPVFVHKMIPYGNRKVAYLAYNHFTAGPTETTGDEQFNNSLREAFKAFKKEHPTDFVLDLRYNSGGLVSCAQLLATMLAPASALDDVFCKLTYNGKGSYRDSELKLDSKYMKEGAGGENLNPNRLFVITSTRTASASEAVINGLKPYLGSNLILIGDTTEGKNVGSVTFEDDRYEWELHPIVSRLSNKDGFSDYEHGFPPDVFCDESDTPVYYELGDEREFMLKPILDYIAHDIPISFGILSALRSADRPLLIPLYNSLERRRTNAVVLDRR